MAGEQKCPVCGGVLREEYDGRFDVGGEYFSCHSDECHGPIRWYPSALTAIAARRAAEIAEAVNAALDKHKHTDECLEYAAQTRRPFCISPCAKSRDAIRARAGRG